MDQYNEMLRLLGEFEADITEEWGFQVARQIPDLLNMNLMLRRNMLLEENFHDDVCIIYCDTKYNKNDKLNNIDVICSERNPYAIDNGTRRRQ